MIILRLRKYNKKLEDFYNEEKEDIEKLRMNKYQRLDIIRFVNVKEC